MPRTAYPNAKDLENFLEGSGFTLSSSLDLAGPVGAGIAAFERAVSRTMLAPLTAQTRLYDPPANRTLRVLLDGDLAVCTSVTLENEVQVSGEDYWLHPFNAPQRGRPYKIIEMVAKSYWYAPMLPKIRGSLQVTGRWGFGVAIPEDAFQAMLCHGARQMRAKLAGGLYSGLVSWSEAGVQENYGQDPLGYLSTAWDAQFKEAVNAYREVMVG